MSDSTGQALKKPDMGTRTRQLDMTQSFTPDLRKRHFHTAFIADDAAVLHAFVFAAEALPIGYRTEDARAEKSVALRFEGPVVDCFWLGHLTMRPLPDFFR